MRSLHVGTYEHRSHYEAEAVSLPQREMDALESQSRPVPSQFGVIGSLNCEFRSCWTGSRLEGETPHFVKQKNLDQK